MALARCFMSFIAVLAVAASALAQTPPATGASPAAGRYQLIVVPGHAASPFMIDTATGCLWHAIQDEKTKRYTFTEVDVENLHWSYASGAQAVLSARIDAAQLGDEQKNALKQNLQKTSCGLFNVTVAPSSLQANEPAPVPKKKK